MSGTATEMRKTTWSKKSLADLADLCLGKMLDQKKNKGQYLPYLANLNVRWGAFDLSDLRQMRFEAREKERYGLKYGDIVMCEGGEPGRCAIWKYERPGMMIQKALHRIRPRAGLDNRFLYYSLLHSGNTGGLVPHASPHFASHQITPKTSRYTRCSMSMFPNVSINGRIRSSGQLGRWWYSISPCRNNECVRRFTVFAFNQRS